MNIKVTTEIFIEKARKIHGDKYDYSKVEYQKAKIPITIICKEHGSFSQTPNNHLNGAGCRLCGIESSNRNSTKSFGNLVKDLEKIHGKIYKYDESSYVNSQSKLKVFCLKHKEYFESTPNALLNGRGCPKCGHEKRNVTKSKKWNTKTFIERSRKVHGDKYNYDNSNYIKAKEKVEIKCNCGHVFWQTPDKHMRGKGCPECRKKLVGDILRKTNGQFIKEAKEVHGYFYDYSLVNYRTIKDNVIILCKEHGKFFQKAGIHLQGNGCPKCSASLNERKIYSIIKKYNIQVITEMKFKDCTNNNIKNPRKLPFDFYLPEYNIIIEYDGKQHFEPVRFGNISNSRAKENLKITQRNDMIKNQYCKKSNILLIRYSYKEDYEKELIELLQNLTKS